MRGLDLGTIGPIVVYLATCTLVAGCSGGMTPAGDDAAAADVAAEPVDAFSQCVRSSDCDDGIFCNGEEACVGGLCEPGAAEDCDDGLDCTTDACAAADDRCVNAAVDVDGDGYGDAECLDRRGVPTGEDCDDGDDTRAPGLAEICDDEGIDEDCNLATRGGRDDDADGFEDARCCNPPGRGSTENCGVDCDDADADVRPDAQELCDMRDNDCDGLFDEGCICDPGETRPCAGMGACGSGVETCVDGRSWSTCSVAAVAETCNVADDDCDGSTDEGVTIRCYRDYDEDGFPAPGVAAIDVCADPSRPAVGSCPSLTTDRAPGAGVADCCDTDALAFPGQTSFFPAFRACGGHDYDCDGVSTQINSSSVGPGACAAAVTLSECMAADAAVGRAQGWMTNEVPNCGASGPWLEDCTWIPASGICWPYTSVRIQFCR